MVNGNTEKRIRFRNRGKTSIISVKKKKETQEKVTFDVEHAVATKSRAAKKKRPLLVFAPQKYAGGDTYSYPCT